MLAPYRPINNAPIASAPNLTKDDGQAGQLLMKGEKRTSLVPEPKADWNNTDMSEYYGHSHVRTIA